MFLLKQTLLTRPFLRLSLCSWIRIIIFSDVSAAVIMILPQCLILNAKPFRVLIWDHPFEFPFAGDTAKFIEMQQAWEKGHSIYSGDCYSPTMTGC